MRRSLRRAVSATLVVVLATLASAAVLCLVPCEVMPAAHASERTPASDHCAGVEGRPSAGITLSGRADSCADQHAWDAPAADRPVSRTGVAIAGPPASIGDQPAIHSPLSMTRLARIPAAGCNPPQRSAPLRI